MGSVGHWGKWHSYHRANHRPLGTLRLAESQNSERAGIREKIMSITNKQGSDIPELFGRKGSGKVAGAPHWEHCTVSTAIQRLRLRQVISERLRIASRGWRGAAAPSDSSRIRVENYRVGRKN